MRDSVSWKAPPSLAFRLRGTVTAGGFLEVSWPGLSFPKTNLCGFAGPNRVGHSMSSPGCF